MTTWRIVPILMAVGLISLGGCASLSGRDPLQVTVAGIEPLQGQGMELRFMVKLRVQNPNDGPIDYTGVALEMDVQGNTFATGVSDTAGSVPRFGESIISVPVTISALRMARQAIELITGPGAGPGKLKYELRGKLAGPAFGGVRFQSSGEMDLPATAPAPAAAGP